MTKDEKELIFNRLLELEEQQPAEWSEVDEAVLNAVIRRYEFAVESDCSVFIKKERLTQMEKELDWLKSLHPQSHWKPSEEQLHALEHAITHLNYWRDNNDVHANAVKQLTSLLDKLKLL